MAYKVLGQATTTAPTTASSVTGFAKDSSFAAYTLTRRITPSSTTVEPIHASSPWKYKVTNTNTSVTSLSVNPQTTAPFGTSNSAYGFFTGSTSGTAYFTQGWKDGQDPDNTPNANSIDLSTAVPVSQGVTYYFGSSLWTSDQSGSGQMRVAWFTAAGAYLSQTTLVLTDTANTWVRSSSSASAPSTAAYAIFDVRAVHSNANAYTFFDGVMFGTVSAATYTEHLLPSAAAIVSPFDKRANGYLTESYFSDTGVIYSGDLQTLYTVPAGKSTVASTLAITNTSGSVNYYRVAVIPSGETLSQKHFLFMDTPISAKSTETITIGITLSAGDVIKVAADNAGVNATLFGSEN